MRAILLFWLHLFIGNICAAQAISINQSKSGWVYLYDALTHSYVSLDTIIGAKVLGVRNSSENLLVAIFGNDVDTFTKVYQVNYRVNEGRSKFQLESSNGKVKNYRFTNTSITVNASASGVIIYDDGKKIGQYRTIYTGPWSAYIENVPLDIDVRLGTMLIEEQVSPTNMLLGGYSTSIIEISIKDGYLWERRKSCNATYSYDRNYILFRSSSNKTYYLNRMSKKIFKEPCSTVAYWL